MRDYLREIIEEAEPKSPWVSTGILSLWASECTSSLRRSSGICPSPSSFLGSRHRPDTPPWGTARRNMRRPSLFLVNTDRSRRNGSVTMYPFEYLVYPSSRKSQRTPWSQHRWCDSTPLARHHSPRLSFFWWEPLICSQSYSYRIDSSVVFPHSWTCAEPFLAWLWGFWTFPQLICWVNLHQLHQYGPAAAIFLEWTA